MASGGTVFAAVSAATESIASPLVPVALQIASRLDDPETLPKDVAALSRELRQVLGRLDDAASVEVDPIDELAAKRQTKSAG